MSSTDSVSGDVETCAICRADYVDTPSDATYIIPECRHKFHASCFDGAMRFRAFCPVCAKRVWAASNGKFPLLGVAKQFIENNSDYLALICITAAVAILFVTTEIHESNNGPTDACLFVCSREYICKPYAQTSPEDKQAMLFESLHDMSAGYSNDCRECACLQERVSIREYFRKYDPPTWSEIEARLDELKKRTRTMEDTRSRHGGTI